MTLEQAIQKAIEGGWNPEKAFRLPADIKISPGWIAASKANWQVPCLDPSFWQSLGKAMGWTKVKTEGDNGGWHYFSAGWVHEWHRFIDHLAEGKSVESFFENLK